MELKMNTNTVHGALHSTSYWGSSLCSNARAKDPLVDQVAIQAIDLISNTSACTRPFNATFFPGPQPVAFSAVGGTTDFGVLQALIATKNAVSGYFAASDMHDGAGQTITSADAISRIGQVFGAAAYGWIRVQDIADRGFHALSNLSYLVPYFAAIGDVGFALLFFFVGVLGLRSCLETRSFIIELDKAINELHSENFEELQVLIGKMTGEGPVSIGTTISERDLYVHLGQQLRALFDEMDPDLVAGSWDSDLGKSLFTEEHKKLLPAVLNRMGITITDTMTLESLQTNPEIIQKVWAKEQKVVYERILGAKGSELVQRA